jgi:hypothetical protein
MSTLSALRESPVETLPQPYLLFLGDTTEPSYAKTAFGLRDWAGDRVVGEWSCAGATVTTGLPRHPILIGRNERQRRRKRHLKTRVHDGLRGE